MTGPLSRLIERWRRPVAEPSAFVVDLSPFTGPIYAVGDVTDRINLTPVATAAS